ncbi:hypothetical protein B0H13DRAFT_2366880 [Mycena leptocephala]|nr:hypothetical protein B0H13DRAFT_2366880 [Mycena leptocephala]
MHFCPSTAALEERANAPMADVDTLPEIAFRVCISLFLEVSFGTDAFKTFFEITGEPAAKLLICIIPRVTRDHSPQLHGLHFEAHELKSSSSSGAFKFQRIPKAIF